MIIQGSLNTHTAFEGATTTVATGMASRRIDAGAGGAYPPAGRPKNVPSSAAYGVNFVAIVPRLYRRKCLVSWHTAHEKQHR